MMTSEPSEDCDYRDRFHPTMDFQLMNSYRLSGVLCDVTIMVNGIEFPAHKIVLAVNSPYFRATFASDFESQAVHTLECDSSAFGAILNTLYTGIMMEITPNTVQEILQAASMLNIPRVMESCCQVMEINMDADNCLDLRELAKANGCTQLAAKTEEFQQLHFDDIVKSSEFVNYPAEKLEFLLSLDTLHASEDSIFLAIMNWTSHDVTSRSVLLTKLLSHLRVPYISQGFLHATAIPFLRANDNCQDYVKKLDVYLELNEDEKFFHSLHSVNPRNFDSEVIIGHFFSEDEWALHVLDSEVGQWTRMTSITKLNEAYGSICVMNGKMYFLKNQWGGAENGKNVMEFDPMTNSERLVGTLGTSRNNPGIVGLNDKIYIVGGVYRDDQESSVEVCSPENNSCNHVASMSRKKFGPAVIAARGRIYAVGGRNHDGDCGEAKSYAEVYIPEEDRWEDIPNMSVGRQYASVVELHGKIYVMGGVSSGDGESKSVECYDPERKKWTKVADLQSDDEVAAAVNWKGVLHVFHSQEEDIHYHTHMEKYDPKMNQWITMTSPVISTYNRSMFVIKKKYLPTSN